MINKLTQRLRFNLYRKEFNAKYNELIGIKKEPYIMPFWQNVNKKVIDSFKPIPKWNFLSNRAIRDTMFVEGDKVWLETQLEYIKKNLPDYNNLVQEDAFGSPKLLPPPHNFTSHNTIHHLYHLTYFLEQTKVDGNKINTVTEWGGGYGNFAKLWFRKFPKSTYVIIDTALFTSIQWLYLSSIFGKDKVNIITPKNTKITPGCINLIPLAMLDKIKIESDLFVSTWGLSESAKEAQDYVVKNKWFGAKHLLIGFQDSYSELPYASRLGDLAKKDGAKIIDISFIPNNHYAIK